MPFRENLETGIYSVSHNKKVMEFQGLPSMMGKMKEGTFEEKNPSMWKVIQLV
jgi:hypothetical protein